MTLYLNCRIRSGRKWRIWNYEWS